MKRLGLSAVILGLLSANAAMAGDYLGKYCLVLTAGDMAEEVQLTVTAVDENNFSLNGTTTNASIAGVGSAIGNAAIVGETIVMTLHKSQADQQGVSISTVNARLGLPFFEGTFHSISQNYTAGFGPMSHVSGAAKLSECNSSLRTNCKLNGGAWLEEFSECVGVSEIACQTLGGQFESCGSACRHNLSPEALCTAQCVAYCSF